MKILESRDCGNSPKNRFVQACAIALETGALPAEAFSSDIVWVRFDGVGITGRDAVAAELKRTMKLSKLVIEHAIAHGKVGAVSGLVIGENGDRRRFCHMLEFTSVKANRVRSVKSFAG